MNIFLIIEDFKILKNLSEYFVDLDHRIGGLQLLKSFVSSTISASKPIVIVCDFTLSIGSGAGVKIYRQFLDWKIKGTIHNESIFIFYAYEPGFAIMSAVRSAFLDTDFHYIEREKESKDIHESEIIGHAEQMIKIFPKNDGEGDDIDTSNFN